MKYFKKTMEYLFVLEKGKRFLTIFLLFLPVGFVAAFGGVQMAQRFHGR